MILKYIFFAFKSPPIRPWGDYLNKVHSFKLKMVTAFDVRATSDNGRRPIAKGHLSCASRKISCYMAQNNKINQLIGYPSLTCNGSRQPGQ